MLYPEVLERKAEQPVLSGAQFAQATLLGPEGFHRMEECMDPRVLGSLGT